MEAVDLYGDLEDPFFFKDQSPQPSSQNSETTDAPSSTKIEEIRQQNEKLKQQNTALKMNISCLYKTARSELERKEAMIERLMARVKKLEATVTEQQQQAEAQAQATSTLTDAQMAAAAYYQAQFMLLANSTASTPTATDDGAGAAVDSNALSEYYRQFLGYVWNDRTPTSSDVEDAGTPLPSDKENKRDKQVLDPCGGPGEVEMSSDKPKELKAKGKRTSNGERERRKVKRSRKHKRSSTEDTLPTISTATEHSPATETDQVVQEGEVDCRKSPNGQDNVPAGVVGINHKVCPFPHDPHHQKDNNLHQSDKCMEASTNASKHYTTCGISEENNNCNSPSKEKLLPKRHRKDQGTKESHRTEPEPQRETREMQRKGGVHRLCSSSQSPTNSPAHERMHWSSMSDGFMEKSTSSQGIMINHSTDPKREDHNQLHSRKGEKQSPNRHGEGRHTKEMQREMKKHHIESTDVQGVINDPHRGNHITRSHSSSRSSHSPTSQNVNGQYQSSLFDGSTDKSALNSDTKAYSRASGVSPSHHTPRIEKHSPKRHREYRETNKSHREVNEPPREVREPHREVRRTYRESREPHAEGDREMMDPHRERRGMHREMRETHRVTKEMYRDMREAHRETRVSYKGEPQHRETREAHRQTKITHRETTKAHRNSWSPRDIQELQIETMELCRDRRMAQSEAREVQRDREGSNNRRSHSRSRLSSSSRLRSRSPSNDKENISRPSSSSQERRPRGEPMGKKLSRSNSLERAGEDIFSKRMPSRKRKLSNSSQSASQHNRKQARRESYQQDSKQTRMDRYSRSSAKSSLESSPKHSNLLASPETFCPGFDDIIAPPTPNANETLPYSTDVQLCENSTVLPYDAGARRNMSDIISCPPTPTSELQGQDEDEEIMNTKDTERESNTKESENKPRVNLNSEQSNEKSMKVKNQEIPKSCLDGNDNPLATDGAVSGVGEPKTEDVVDENGDKEKEEASDLEEGEITDSDSDSGDKTESATKKETIAGDEPDRSIKRRQVKTSESYRTQELEKRACCEQLSDERRSRRSSYHGSGGHRPRHSPQPSHHIPLSERRNRHSPPSPRNELYDRESHVLVKHSHSERHAQCRRSSRHLRSNLPEQIY